jgi:hypothetical protein
MTRPESAFAPRRFSQRVTSSVAAIALTALMLVASDALAADTNAASPEPQLAVQFAPEALSN